MWTVKFCIENCTIRNLIIDRLENRANASQTKDSDVDLEFHFLYFFGCSNPQ